MIQLLSGCVSNMEFGYSDEEAASLTEDLLSGTLLGTQPSLVEPEVNLLTLSDEFKALLDHEISQRSSSRQKIDTLRELMFGPDKLNIQYSANATLTAAETLSNRAGNCLSLTSLYIAAARHLGIDAEYHVVSVRPTWNFESMTMIRYEHIVATGRIGGEEYVMDFLPEYVLDENDSYTVTDDLAMSLYHANRGAELLIKLDYDQAYAHMRRALRLNLNSSDIWNNMGALLSRNGIDKHAEFAYRKALSLDRENYSALNNLASLYRRLGQESKSDDYLAKVSRYRIRNPYYHYFLAQFAFDKQMFAESRALLIRAIKMKRDEPDFYAALARLSDLDGNTSESGSYRALAEKYRLRRASPPPRENSHRYFTRVLKVQ